MESKLRFRFAFVVLCQCLRNLFAGLCEYTSTDDESHAYTQIDQTQCARGEVVCPWKDATRGCEQKVHHSDNETDELSYRSHVRRRNTEIQWTTNVCASLSTRDGFSMSFVSPATLPPFLAGVDCFRISAYARLSLEEKIVQTKATPTWCSVELCTMEMSPSLPI